MSVINTNVKSLVAQDSIMKSNRTLSTAMERLSTGKRINSAADDAAGLSIATRMDSQVRGLTQAIRNANDGISIVQTTEGALDEVTSMLQRMRELAVQSGNDSNNAADRKALQDEVEQLKKEIDRVATTTQFNNMNLLDGTYQKKQLQIGDKANQTMQIDIQSAKTVDLGKSSSDTNDRTLVSSRVNLGTGVSWAEGQIKINDVGLSAFSAASGNDIETVINDINGKNLGVKASGFNVVVADTAGTGVTAAGDLTIKVKALGASETTYAISASNSMAELVDNINKEVGGAVQASVNSEGKLVLSNSSGATIKVTDSGGIKQSGFTAAAERTYQGFLKLESTDGNPIRIEQGDLDDNAAASSKTLNKLSNMGFVASVRNNTTDGFTVRGAGITSSNASTAWQDGDLKINGINIYSQQVATNSLQGKVDAINAFTAQTGVKASMYAQQTFTTTSTGQLAVFTATDTVMINGVQTAAIGATADTFVAAVNAVKDKTNVTAELIGTNIRITGRDTNQVSMLFLKSDNTVSTTSKLGVVDQSSGAVTATASTAAAPISISAGIQLDSEVNKPISIQLSAAADSNANAVQSASQAAGTRAGAFGFLEQNVGAADFDTNLSTLNPLGSQALSRIDITSTSGVANAIGVIDNAIRQVNESRSYLGAVQNRLDKTVNNLTSIVTNTQQSRSRIQDADYGVEAANLAKAQIIQQAATAMLAQANQQPQSVLSLLK